MMPTSVPEGTCKTKIRGEASDASGDACISRVDQKCTSTIGGGNVPIQFISPQKCTSTFWGRNVPVHLSPPTGYLLLNLENLGRGTKGMRMFCFSPLDFASKKLPGTSLFCHEASANQPIQVKPALLSLFVLDWTQ
jgi:hypothetical protein